MPFEPRDETTIYESIRDRLAGRIEKLTNFIDGSFNDVWVSSFSQEIRDNEIRATASQLSGWIDYAGGPVTEDDLDRLGIDNVTAEELNEYMDEEDLDELVSLLGVERDNGERATGVVEVRTVSGGAQIPEGTEFGTNPDSLGNYLSFYTTEDVSNQDDTGTYVDIPVEAAEVGQRYNVGTGQVDHMPNPPTGVQDVTNHEEITGGTNRESQQDLRARAKDSVFASSGGGTTSGIEGYVEDNTRSQSVFIEEFKDEQPPYVDVIVDGGEDDAVRQAIDESRPTGIRHNLIRPDIVSVGIDMVLPDGDWDLEEIQSELYRLFRNLDTGDPLRRDRVIQTVLNSDSTLDYIDTLDIYVEGEEHEYNHDRGSYELDREVDELREVWMIFSNDQIFFTEGDDFTFSNNQIHWQSNGDVPVSGEFFVSYDMGRDIEIAEREKAGAGTIDIE